MTWQSWIEQRNPHTEFQRSGATVWLKGDPHLIDDPDGPYEHLHDRASEVLVFLSGKARLTMGSKEYFFGPRELALLPADIPHNLFSAADEDMLLFWLVAPNVFVNKWRTTDLPTGPFQQELLRGFLREGHALPCDEFIHNEFLQLGEGLTYAGQTTPRQEAVILIVEGQARVKNGQLQSALHAPQFVHVTRETNFHVQAQAGPASVLLIKTVET
jgi:mannose-6-phosphate isomerase-like protein (cupin superfamily)